MVLDHIDPFLNGCIEKNEIVETFIIGSSRPYKSNLFGISNTLSEEQSIMVFQCRSLDLIETIVKWLPNAEDVAAVTMCDRFLRNNKKELWKAWFGSSPCRATEFFLECLNMMQPDYDIDETDQISVKTPSSESMMNALELALTHGADVHYEEDTALEIAIEDEFVEIVRFLIKHGADVNAQKGHIFYMAVADRQCDVVRELVLGDVSNENMQSAKGCCTMNLGELLGILPTSDGKNDTDFIEYIVNYLDIMRILLAHGEDETSIDTVCPFKNETTNHRL